MVTIAKRPTSFNNCKDFYEYKLVQDQKAKQIAIYSSTTLLMLGFVAVPWLQFTALTIAGAAGLLTAGLGTTIGLEQKDKILPPAMKKLALISYAYYPEESYRLISQASYQYRFEEETLLEGLDKSIRDKNYEYQSNHKRLEYLYGLNPKIHTNDELQMIKDEIADRERKERTLYTQLLLLKEQRYQPYELFKNQKRVKRHMTEKEVKKRKLSLEELRKIEDLYDVKNYLGNLHVLEALEKEPMDFIITNERVKKVANISGLIKDLQKRCVGHAITEGEIRNIIQEMDETSLACSKQTDKRDIMYNLSYKKMRQKIVDQVAKVHCDNS